MLKAKLKALSLSLYIVLLIFSSLYTFPSAVSQEPGSSPSVVAELRGLPIAFSEDSAKIRLNFTMFIIDFYKSGYEVLYSRNGSILVNYHNMWIEYFNPRNNKWTQISDFQGVRWIKHDDWRYTVEKRYRDASTNPISYYTVSYDVRSDSRIKITITIENGGQARRYRLYWALDGIVYADWKECKNADNVKHKLLFGNELIDHCWLAIDWQDIYEQFQLDISSYSVSTSAQGRKADIYFTFPAEVQPSEVLTVDPSIVGTTASITTIGGRGFIYSNRIWVFYCDSNEVLGFKSSTDGGNSWSSFTSVASGVRNPSFDVYFNGTHVFLAYKPFSESNVYFRMGSPNPSTGAISWRAAAQTVANDVQSNLNNQVAVACDSSNKPWVAYEKYVSNYQVRIKRTSRTDGTWVDDGSPFPYTTTFGHGAMGSQKPLLVPLLSGKMYIIGFMNSAPYVKGVVFNGATFTEESMTLYESAFGSYGYSTHSAVALGDDVYYCYVTSNNRLCVSKRTWGSGWGTDWVIANSVNLATAPVIAKEASNVLCVFYLPNSWSIAVVRFTGSSWTGAGSLGDSDIQISSLSAFSLGTMKYGLVYTTGTSSPYNVVFASFSLNQPPQIGGFQAPGTVYANKYFYLNATVNDPDGVSQIVNATMEISNGVILKWVASTNTFSKHQDTYGYCTLDAGGSVRTQINSTAYRLSWKIKLNWNYPEGYVSVLSANTKVFDSQGASSSNSYSNLFYFEDDLIVASASVDDDRVNPLQSVTFSGTIYYQGTTTPPEDASGITVYVQLGSVQKGNTTTISPSGTFSIPISAETPVGLYSYNIYCRTDENSVQNRTVNVIVDRLIVSYKGVDVARRNVGTYGEVRFKLCSEFDGSPVESGSVFIEGITASFDPTNKWWKISYSMDVVGQRSFAVATVYWDVYGITALNPGVSTNSTSIVWDAMAIVNRLVDMDGDRVYARAMYAYDDQPIVNCTVGYCGLYAFTNSTGWAVFDLSTLSDVVWNQTVYAVYEPAYGLTRCIMNVTVPYCKVRLSPFSLRGTGEIRNVSWDSDRLVLAFTASGTCIVRVGSLGPPTRVEVNGAAYENWKYDSVRQEVKICGLASHVAIFWAPFGGATPPPPASLSVQIVDLGNVQPGSSREFTVTVMFDLNTITIQKLDFADKKEWITIMDKLPMVASRGLSAIGSATIKCKLTLPQDTSGKYTIPLTVTAATTAGNTITASSYITFNVTPTQTPYVETITRALGNPAILLLLAATTAWLATYTVKKR